MELLVGDFALDIIGVVVFYILNFQRILYVFFQYVPNLQPSSSTYTHEQEPIKTRKANFPTLKYPIEISKFLPRNMNLK